MIDQTFSAKNLVRLTTRLDPKRYRLGGDRTAYLRSLQDISEAIHEDSFNFSAFSRSIRNGKPVFSVTTPVDEFALRKLNDNVRRVYNVKQANRGEIIGQVIPLLKEEVPFHLIKLDVRDFYESINRRLILDVIARSSILSFRSKRLLDRLLDISGPFKLNGLPRGISLSATLSEIYMMDFDRLARTLSGIYYYARYVDDIIVFCYSEPSTIRNALMTGLPNGMELNSTKERILSFNNKGNCLNFPGTAPEISYLGYRFLFRDQSKMPVGNQAKGSPPLPPRLVVRIAESKMKKIKRRIMLSLFSFFRDKDFKLLVDRFKFLTGNCKMKRDADNGRLLSGIFYNYQLIDVTGIADLTHLTDFLRKAVLSKRGGFGTKLQTLLTPEQRRQLISFSFETGFRQRITHKLSPQRLQRIKRCWHHV